jgi:hypothetical protein
MSNPRDIGSDFAWQLESLTVSEKIEALEYFVAIISSETHSVLEDVLDVVI